MRATQRAVLLTGGVLAATTLAAGALAVRDANPVPLSAAAGCAAATAAGHWKAVFGTRPTLEAALTLFRKAEHAGFKNLVLVHSAPNAVEVDLFGIPSYKTGLELVRGARSALLQVSIQPSRDLFCPDGDADWEAVFGHRKTVPPVLSLGVAVVKAGFKAARIERDGVRDYELEVPGIASSKQGRAFQAEAKSAGYRVTLERS